MEPLPSFENLKNMVVGWKPLVEGICSKLNDVDVSVHLKEDLIQILRNVDPWEMDKKMIKSWERILSQMKIPEARLWEGELRAGAVFLSEIVDNVAKEITPEMTSWEALKWKIQCRFQK
jgi:hypothetical protein